MEALTLHPMAFQKHHYRNLLFLGFLQVVLFMLPLEMIAQKGNNNLELIERYQKLREQDTVSVELIKQIINNYQYADKITDSAVYWIDSLRIAGRQLNRPDLIAYSDIYQAQVYIRQLDDSRAMEYLYRAITQFRKQKNSVGEAYSFMQIGLIYYLQKQYDESIENLRISADFYEKEAIDSSLSTVYYLIGLCNIELHQWNDAEFMLNQSLVKNTFTNKSDRYFECYVALANLYTLQQKYTEASKMFNEIYTFWNDPDDNYGKCMLYIPYSRMLLGIGQPDSAYHTLKIAWEIANEYSLTNLKIEILNLFSTYYSEIKDYKEANNYLVKYYNLRDSVFSSDRHKTVDMLKTRIEFDRQQDKITALMQRQKVNRLQKIVLGLFVFMLLALSISLFRRYRFKNRKEKELNKANTELNIALENIKKAQNQLIQTEKMASLGRMSVNLAHELRNPLNFVINFTKLTSELIQEMNHSDSKIQNQELSEEINKNLELIYQHSLRAEKIIFDMVKHTQMPNKKRTIDNLNKMISDFSNVALFSYKSHSADFNCSILISQDSHIKEVNISPHELMTVVMIVINNAFDSMYQRMQSFPGFDPVLKIITQNKSQSVEITIIDNGNGISDEIIDRIYEPFFTTKPLGKGTGLGLSMAYEITKSFNGKITTKSIPGFQTEFIIAIPYNS
ncbi:MAG: tetratricopeptide repeat-containing sensor histidine kinase [Bacteroidetes bacterium]|nr:tetratricopeptide repeat-containing sensor histidine kinase [Bacteroidota bacterium]